MAHGSYSFFASSLSHLVQSLVQVKEVPWCKVSQLISLCPRSDVPPGSVSYRQHIAVCALADYFTLSGVSHCEKLLNYFLTLLNSLPDLQWRISSHYLMQEGEFVAFNFSQKISKTILTVYSVLADDSVLMHIIGLVAQYMNKITDIEYLKSKDHEELLNFTAPAMLGLCSGIKSFIECQSSGDCPENTKVKLSQSAHQLLHMAAIKVMSPGMFSSLNENWLPVSFEQRNHPMNQFPYILLSELLALSRSLVSEVDNHELCERLLEATQHFSDIEYQRLYPKIKATNSVSRSCNVTAVSVRTLCEAIELTTLLVNENNAYQHYQKLTVLFNTVVNTKTPDLERLPLQVACVTNIGILTERFPVFIDDALESFKQMLFKPSTNLTLLQTASCLEPVQRSDTQIMVNSFEQPNLQRSTFVRRSNRPKPENMYSKHLFTLRNAIVESLCKVIKTTQHTHSQSTQAFLSSASNQLCSIGDQEKVKMISGNAVLALGSIAVHIHSDEEAVKMVISIFQHRLCNPPSHLDTQMIHQLGRIMVHGNNTAYNAVLSLFLQISSKACSEATAKNNKDTTEHHGYRHCSFTVIKTLEGVFSKMENKQRLQEMIPWLLELFVQRSLEIQKVCEREKQSLKDQAGNLGVLLPVFATLMARIDEVENVNTKTRRLFRDFWQICVVMNFVTKGLGHYSEEWYEGVQAVAIKTPLISSMGADTFLQHDLQYNSALRLDGPLQESEIRSSMSETLRAPELNSIIYRLSYAQCTFFMSAYNIELMKVSSNTSTCYHLFNYLQDKGIQKDKSGIYGCFEYMSSVMFDRYLDNLSSNPRDEARQLELETLSQFLLVKFNHSFKKIRHCADKWLTKLIGKFSHLLWSKNVLECLAFLTQVLVDTTKSAREAQGVYQQIPIPYKPGNLDIAEEREERVNMLKDFSYRFASVLKESLSFAPTEKLSMLKEYEDKLKKAIKGFDIVLEDLEAPPQRTKGAWHELQFDDSISKANRSKYYGHIEGMKSLVFFQGSEFDFSEMVLQKMQAALEKWDKNPTGSVEQLEESIHHTTAYLLSEETLNRKALRALSWIPVRCFTKESLEIATSCWEWVVSKRPDFEVHLLMENIAAWNLTVHRRIGLFSKTVLCKRPVVTDGDQVELNDLAPNCEPHGLWISFLTRRFQVVKWRCAKQVELFTSLFHTSLPLTSRGGSLLSNHINAIGPRFRFLHLGLLLLQNDFISNELNQSILRERIYTAILDYFCVTAQWPCFTTARVLQDSEVLESFWDTLFHDKKYLKSILVPTTISPDSIPSANNMLGQSLFVDGANSPSQRSRTLSVEQRSKAPSVNNKKGSKMGDYKSKYHLKKRNLILFLINHEIERLTTWAEPLRELPYPDDKKTLFVNKNFSEKTWHEYMQLAWTCHPMLTVGLALRVRNSDVIQKAVRMFVKAAPANFYGCIEALPILATRLHVKQDIPQLSHMLAWTPAAPLEALTYFSKEFDEHPITGQYALQSIQSYSCETLLFLVPQVVQATRHDPFGYVRQVIMWIANLSPIVTHQIIWNMKTNMYLDEEGTQIEPMIGTLLESYIKTIVDGMTGKDLEFYQREFEFFDTVTEISSTIKPYPKGVERREACLKALATIKLGRFGVYLPSNPDAVVVDIKYDSGRPMQSAAKAPFLATFKVKECKVVDMQAFDNKTADITRGVSWKSCIFKEGDDLRQDILALQVIDLCLTTIKTCGLDVYLKPYKVVATAPGSGVIECVPDSKSRDDLGKSTDENLYDYFLYTYGDEKSIEFQNARENFVKSMAGYSILSYILQIKDRHNGNIMIDKDGHLIHIDFGFLFESSPGGNMGFEPDIKLTTEMILIMGGSVDAAPFKRFVELCTRTFLAIRPYCEQICTLVSLMMETNFPCFRDDALRKLRFRFQPTLSDRDAAAWIKKMIRDNTKNPRTVVYDALQWYQNDLTY